MSGVDKLMGHSPHHIIGLHQKVSAAGTHSCPLSVYGRVCGHMALFPSRTGEKRRVEGASLRLEVVAKVSILLLSHGQIGGPHTGGVLWRKGNQRNIHNILHAGFGSQQDLKDHILTPHQLL